MNKRLIALISALALGTALPVFAGPDWQAIEQAHRAKQANQAARRGDAEPAGTEACPPHALVPPLDHGPRAQSTPYLNQLRKDRHDAQVKACKEPKK